MEQKEEETFKIGQRFREPISFQEYILARCNYKTVVLISLRSGNRFKSPVRVADANNITFEEMIKLGGYDFTKMDEVIYMKCDNCKYDFEAETFRVGQRLKVGHDLDYIVLLCHVGNRFVQAITVHSEEEKSGNYWSEKVLVKDLNKISKDELISLLGMAGLNGSFKLIK